jgi:hypothetical protein
VKDDDFNLPLKDTEVSIKDFVVKAGGQDVMWKPSPQCPKHWYILETDRGSEPYTIKISACFACVKEKNNA